MPWYSAKILFKHKTKNGEVKGLFEERMIVLNVDNESKLETIITDFANTYAEETGNCKFIELIDYYEMDCSGIFDNGQEIFSKMYSTNLTADKFTKSHYFDDRLNDCSKHNCVHSWYKHTENKYKCYYCRKTKQIRTKKNISAS